MWTEFLSVSTMFFLSPYATTCIQEIWFLNTNCAELIDLQHTKFSALKGMFNLALHCTNIIFNSSCCFLGFFNSKQYGLHKWHTFPVSQKLQSKQMETQTKKRIRISEYKSCSLNPNLHVEPDPNISIPP